MEFSLDLHSRKRKQCSSSNPINGRFTRSMSEIHSHRCRSGRAWPDAQARARSQYAKLLLDKPLEKPRNVPHPLPENGASLDLSIKDLRARARRIFSPASFFEEENRKLKAGMAISGESCNGDSNLVDNCEKLDLGIPDLAMGVRNLDRESDLGITPSNKGKPGDREDARSFPKNADPILGFGSNGQPEKEEVVNLNEKTPVMDKNSEGNKVENGKDCSGSKRNGSISGSRSVLNTSSKRKVFRAPSSFSYRRLLPFLVEMAKDDSSVSKIDVVDVGYHCEVKSLKDVDPNLSSDSTACYAGKHKHTDNQCDHTKKLEEGYYRSSGVQLPLKEPDLDDPAKKMVKSEANVRLSDVEQRYHENGVKDELIEEFVQTTPPEDSIFSELDNVNAEASGGNNVLPSGNHVVEKPLNGTNANNGICSSVKSHPANKSKTIVNSKLVLNPCYRSKLFKSSSFSYRRLLPFLTDVAKSTSNIDEHTKFQREDNEGHPIGIRSLPTESADDSVPINRTRTASLPGNQAAKDQKLFARPINPPVSGSSDDISPNYSTTIVNSGDSLLNEKSRTAYSVAIANPDLPIQERAMHFERVTSESSGMLEMQLPTNKIKCCPSEANCSAEKSCSTTNQESLTRESKTEVSQIVEHVPSDIGKECLAPGLDYNKDELQLIKSVSMYQSSIEVDKFIQGNQGDIPITGILKRNPRGCRGLCNCLNCSSFRLHAERSFEFSKNQMLDAEEVAQGLVNELAALRNLLAKSVSGGRDLVTIQINQANEACKRALRIEKLAKTRLTQMNDDLNTHCRITPLQRPRVAFSTYIEEIAIPKTDIAACPDIRKEI